MPINDTPDLKNVANIHHGILCSHKKRVYALCRDMSVAGNHYSQQINTITENEILHVLTHRHMMNNENTWTQWGSITHWGLLEVAGGAQSGGGDLGPYPSSQEAVLLAERRGGSFVLMWPGVA